METNDLILVNRFCSICEVEPTFIDALNEHGLVELVVVNEERYISIDRLKDVERAVHFHYELDINLEGIGVISDLLKQIHQLQLELMIAKEKSGRSGFERLIEP